jgi:SCY1-like protein 2
MPATAMFSKFKHGATGQSPLDTNPIVQYFEIGKQTATAGPELVWRIHDAYRKSDGKVSTLPYRMSFLCSLRVRRHESARGTEPLSALSRAAAAKR